MQLQRCIAKMSIRIAMIVMPFTFLAIVFSLVKFHLLFTSLWLFSEQANKAIFSTFSKSSMYFALLLNSQNYRICFINSRQQVHNQYMICNMAKCVIIHIKNYIRWLKNVKSAMGFATQQEHLESASSKSIHPTILSLT